MSAETSAIGVDYSSVFTHASEDSASVGLTIDAFSAAVFLLRQKKQYATPAVSATPLAKLITMSAPMRRRAAGLDVVNARAYESRYRGWDFKCLFEVSDGNVDIGRREGQ